MHCGDGTTRWKPTSCLIAQSGTKITMLEVRSSHPCRPWTFSNLSVLPETESSFFFRPSKTIFDVVLMAQERYVEGHFMDPSWISIHHQQPVSHVIRSLHIKIFSGSFAKNIPDENKNKTNECRPMSDKDFFTTYVFILKKSHMATKKKKKMSEIQ